MASMAMIRDQIKRIVRNKSWSDADILGLMNRGMKRIAGGMTYINPDKSQALSPPLWDLATASTVTTSLTLPYVTMPTTFQRDLYMVVNLTTNVRIQNLFPTYAEFRNYYPQAETNPLTCSVIGCARRGTELWYQGIPTTAESLQLHFYRNPVPNTEATIESAPDGLPEHLQEELLIAYCAKYIWTEIESGVAAQMTNTKLYDERLNAALVDLANFYPTPRESVVFAPDSDMSYWEGHYYGR